MFKIVKKRQLSDKVILMDIEAKQLPKVPARRVCNCQSK